MGMHRYGNLRSSLSKLLGDLLVHYDTDIRRIIRNARVISQHGHKKVSCCDDLVLRLFVEGGSDASRFRLDLSVGPKLVLDGESPIQHFSIKLSHLPVIFLPWFYHETNTPRDAVDINRENPSMSSFTFSSCLRNVQWTKIQLDAVVQASVSDIFGQSPPALLSWEYDDPICMGFTQDLGLVDEK